MKTRTEIVAMASEIKALNGAAVKALDDALLERFRALKNQPAAQAEWLLAVALADLQSTANKLETAAVGATKDAHDIGNALRWGMALPALDDDVVRLPALHAAYLTAHATFARALDAYKALAAEVLS